MIVQCPVCNSNWNNRQSGECTKCFFPQAEEINPEDKMMFKKKNGKKIFSVPLKFKKVRKVEFKQVIKNEKI